MSGTVRLTTMDEDHQEVLVDEPVHGEFFGFASMLQQKQHQHNNNVPPTPNVVPAPAALLLGLLGLPALIWLRRRKPASPEQPAEA